MHDLTLLIQLFGRDVIDGLLHAGFDTNEAIARAGPERVAEDTGVPLPLARRIVAVAMESQVLDEQAPPPAAPAPKKPARSKRPAPGGPEPSSQEHIRRPLRRPHSPLASTAGPGQEATAHAEDDAAEEAREEGPVPPLDGDPFIDDAGLVSWMGFSSRAGSSRMISVADAILDPREPHADSVPAPAGPVSASAGIPAPAGSGSAPAGPVAAPADPAAVSTGAVPAPAASARPPVAARAPGAVRPPLATAPAPGAARLVGGSFWSFGTLRHVSEAPAAEPQAPDTGHPAPPDDVRPRRRRSSDER